MWKKVTIILLAILGLAGTGFGVYYFMNQNTTKQDVSNVKVDENKSEGKTKDIKVDYQAFFKKAKKYGVVVGGTLNVPVNDELVETTIVDINLEDGSVLVEDGTGQQYQLLFDIIKSYVDAEMENDPNSNTKVAEVKDKKVKEAISDFEDLDEPNTEFNSQISQLMNDSFNNINTMSDEDLSLTYFMSYPDHIDSLRSLSNQGFTLDLGSLVVYDTENDNVLQFAIVFRRQSIKKVVTGFYAKDLEAIRILDIK